MIPRRAEKIKIFLSVVIYVVKAAFVLLSAIVESPANAGVTRLCGVSPCPVPDTATALPKHRVFWEPCGLHMLGANELPLRQGFRLWRKRLYGACRAAPSCDGVPVADGSQKAEAFLVTHALPDHRVGAPKLIENTFSTRL